MEKSFIIAIVMAAVLAIGINASTKITNKITNDFCLGECNNNLCEGVENNTAIPNEAGCEHFFICIDGQAQANTCPQGQWFNANISQCDNSTNTCENQFECPPDGIHFFPHDRYCDKFIMCFAGYPVPMRCADGLYFDRELEQCNFQDQVECELEICPPYNDPENITFIPSEKHCDEYYICIDGEPIHFTCPEGLHFNAELRTCDFIESANCTIGTTPAPEPPGPPEPLEIDCDCACTVFFAPHPNSCEWYFICSNGRSNLFECAPGLWFDPINFWCDSPELVQCGANTTTIEPPSSPPCQDPQFNCSANEYDNLIAHDAVPVVLTPVFAP